MLNCLSARNGTHIFQHYLQIKKRITMKPNEQVIKPFFAQFLEKQRTTRQEPPIFTLKIWDQLEHTLKYPSDGDEV